MGSEILSVFSKENCIFDAFDLLTNYFEKKGLFSTTEGQRNNSYPHFIKKPKSAAINQIKEDDESNKFSSLKKINVAIRPKYYAVSVFQEMELYIFNKDFSKSLFSLLLYFPKKIKECISSKSVNITFTLVCLHAWILHYILSKKVDMRSFFLNRSLGLLLKDYTADYVYCYQDFFDGSVYEELLRMKRTLFYSLDDLFLYNYKNRTLREIIMEEILHGEFQEDAGEISKLETYITSHVEYLSSLSSLEIAKNHVYWGV